MDVLNLGLVVGSTDLLEETHAILHSQPVRVVLEQRELGDVSSFIEKLERVQPDVLLIGYQLIADDLEHVVAQIKATAGSPEIVLVNNSADPDIILRSMRCGANEYVYPPMSADLPVALERIASQRAKSRAGTRPRGKVLGFVGAKGGCGATTLTCHVGQELQRQTNLQVLLADFDIDSGMIGFLMKSQSRYTLSDALASAHRLDPSLWKALVSNGYKGIDVLMAPRVSATREVPDPRSFRYIVPFARGTYDWTLLDMGRSLTAHTVGALSEADETFLVTTSDIPALHQSKEVVQALLDAGISQHHLHVVLNRTPKRLDISLEELDRMLGVPVYATVPDEYGALHEAYSNGTLLPPNSSLSKHFARVAAKIIGVQPKAQKKAFGLFSF